MADVAGWTALAIAVALVLALISMLLGLAGEAGIFKGAPWVTLMLGFGLLNIVLLSAGIWVAHLVSPVTSDAAKAVAKGQIYLPYLVTSGAPLVAWAVVLALVAFALVEAGRCLFSGGLPAAAAEEYRAQARRSGKRRPGRGSTGTGRVSTRSPRPRSRMTTTAAARPGRRRSPGSSSWPARRTTPPGCCGPS